MTGDRSSNGVRGLRAMFEHNEAASPDSRGRSPSNNGDSQPLPKVRTSFVSVEPVGQLGKAIDGMKGDSTNMNGVKEAGDPAVAVHADHTDRTMTNGMGSGSKQMTLPAETAPTAQPDKSVLAVEDAEASMRPSDPKDEAAVSGGAALPPPAEDLLNKQLKPSVQAFATPGSSPRKPRKLRKYTTGPTSSEEDPTATALPAKLVSAVEEEGASVTSVELKGKAAIPGAGSLPPQAEQSQDVQSEGPTDTPATPGSSLTNGTESHETPSGPNSTSVESAPNETNSAELQTSLAATQPKSSPAKAASSKTPSSKTSPTKPTTTPNRTPSISFKPAPTAHADESPAVVSEPPTTPSHPSARVLESANKPSPRASTRKASRSSLTAPTASPASKAVASKPRTSISSAKSPSHTPVKETSHVSPSAKPQSKRPTRPVRLSSHLTTPTASSAAKHETSPSSTKNDTVAHTSPDMKPQHRGTTRPVRLLSHLTAPTASSTAKHDAPPAPKTNGASHASPDAKSHRREPTRPMQLPSHLTAPTASSAAKHESSQPQSDGSGLARKPSVMSRNTSGSAALRSSTRSSKPPSQPLSKRSSLVKRSDSRANQQPQRPESRAGDAPKRPAAGFLERMMRPTTSTASKTHDKTDIKSPPRRTASVRTNGPKGTATGKRVNSRAQPALTGRNEGANGVDGHGTGGAAGEGQGEVNNSTLGGILQNGA